MHLLLERVALGVDDEGRRDRCADAGRSLQRHRVRRTAPPADGCSLVQRRRRSEATRCSAGARRCSWRSCDWSRAESRRRPSRRGALDLAARDGLGSRCACCMISAMRSVGTPKRCRSASIALRAGDAQERRLENDEEAASRAMTNGRTAAANGCGASTMIASKPVMLAGEGLDRARIEREGRVVAVGQLDDRDAVGAHARDGRGRRGPHRDCEPPRTAPRRCGVPVRSASTRRRSPCRASPARARGRASSCRRRPLSRRRAKTGAPVIRSRSVSCPGRRSDRR